ncbi:MAG: hypothetical protein WA966_02695 [Ornithinimicrobium sp.]
MNYLGTADDVLPLPNELLSLAGRSTTNVLSKVFDVPVPSPQQLPGAPEARPMPGGLSVLQTPASPQLTEADRTRLRRVLRSEFDEPMPRVIRPEWAGNRYLPGLVVSYRHPGSDIFGVAQSLAELDSTFRSAAATIENWHSNGADSAIAKPMRPERGGLRLLDAQPGSFEVWMTLWGDLTTLATSAPVSVASLAALIWQMRVAPRKVADWTFRQSNDLGRKKPVAGHALDDTGTTFGVAHTAALMPVLATLAQQGTAFQFHVQNEAGEEILLTAYERTGGPAGSAAR